MNPALKFPIVERLIAAVSPAWARNRRLAEMELLALSGGKLSSEHSDATAPVDVETHPDNDTIPDSGKQRRRCTLAYTNNSLVKGIVESQVRQVAGSVSVQAQTGSSRLDAAIETEWTRLLEGKLLDLIKLATRHLLIDGGCVLRPLSAAGESFRGEVLPYRRIKTPYDKITSNSIVRDGFEFANGEPAAVYVEVEESSYDQVWATGKTERVPLFSHPVLPRLAGQTKGLSWYSAAITRLEVVNRWMMALLRSAELHAYVIGLVRSTQADASSLLRMSGVTNKSASTSDGTANKKVMEFAQKHRMMFLPDGADYKIIQANAPVVAEFLIWNLRLIARALGVSFERLTYDLSNTSFSSTKFGDRDDRITVKEHQDLVLSDVLRPLNRLIIDNLFLGGQGDVPGAGKYLSDPEAIYRSVYFTLPGRPPVDELKAEQATQIALQNRTTSRGEVLAMRGQDYEVIVEQINREDRLFVESRRDMYVGFGIPKDKALDMALADQHNRWNKPLAADPETDDDDPKGKPNED